MRDEDQNGSKTQGHHQVLQKQPEPKRMSINIQNFNKRKVKNDYHQLKPTDSLQKINSDRSHG